MQTSSDGNNGHHFDKTRTELRVWFAAIWYITSQRHGVSALGLQRVLGLGSYETAWTMLHRLRRAMVRPDRELLHGEVKVDETYLALTDRIDPISAVGRKSNITKVLVAIAVEMLKPKGFGRIRVQRIDRGDHDSLMPFIKTSIRSGSLIHSDGSPAYRQLKENGYEHRQCVHLGAATPVHESMPGVHRVASLLQRWMMGTHHGAVQPDTCSLDSWTIVLTNIQLRRPANGRERTVESEWDISARGVPDRSISASVGEA